MKLGRYTLNHQARLMLNISTPVRHGEIQNRTVVYNDEAGFVKALTKFHETGLLKSLIDLLESSEPSQIDLPEAHIQWLQEMGLLMPADQIPQTPVFAPELACTHEPSPEVLTLNPSLILQTEEAPPAGLAPFLPGWEQFSRQRPLVWFKVPMSQIWLPCWLPAAFQAALTQSGWSDPVYRSALYQAGLLLTPQQSEWLGPARAQHISELQAQIKCQEYLILRQVIPPLHRRHLSRYMHQLSEEGFFQSGDTFVPLRTVIHNQALMRFLHLQITPFVQEILGQAIQPSYAYLSCYQQGSVLPRHTDRAQCDWNMTLLVNQQPESAAAWPFWIETASGIAKVELEIGDMVLYSGTRNPHWREQLPKNQQVLVGLFHFVSPGFKGSLL